MPRTKKPRYIWSVQVSYQKDFDSAAKAKAFAALILEQGGDDVSVEIEKYEDDD